MIEKYKKDAQTRAKRTISGVNLKVKSEKKKKENISNIRAIRSKKTVNIENKKLKDSSKQWLLRHINDRFVAAAKKDGYISRAAYKIIEIAEKFKVFDKQNTINIVDLGAAPGSWSEVIIRHFGDKINLVMVDLLELKTKIEGENVHFIQGDFTDIKIQDEIISYFNEKKIDLILSDIAANISGISSMDSLIMENILDNIISFTKLHLKSKGNLVFKGFHDCVSSDLMKNLRSLFKTVKIFKPEASRQSSSEIYVVCINLK
ncbi:RlmE family RNA methyltransferase [Candidatus Deianiraea vastatrix]|uniref:Ribosomal RNA large subunit methyltransferase E n=1 Tax=Candidatus Deianiraea vastatrix TaxID=2163644 RepID=A0A5B8XD07_9RICK|nr:RlmE family RNA methyltransferase [Candidatus Deianiraea vastatrix]QED23259.1 Ribosomal RNA large subunit methyltransferase E [Candidatus Deianiraea vastatrix]